MNTASSKDDAASSPHELQRKLSNRHLQLIAIGGAIGTGLFMGSGKTIALAGPSILFILYDYWRNVLFSDACIRRNFAVQSAL